MSTNSFSIMVIITEREVIDVQKDHRCFRQQFLLLYKSFIALIVSWILFTCEFVCSFLQPSRFRFDRWVNLVPSCAIVSQDRLLLFFVFPTSEWRAGVKGWEVTAKGRNEKVVLVKTCFGRCRCVVLLTSQGLRVLKKVLGY